MFCDLTTHFVIRGCFYSFKVAVVMLEMCREVEMEKGRDTCVQKSTSDLLSTKIYQLK